METNLLSGLAKCCFSLSLVFLFCANTEVMCFLQQGEIVPQTFPLAPFPWGRSCQGRVSSFIVIHHLGTLIFEPDMHKRINFRKQYFCAKNAQIKSLQIMFILYLLHFLQKNNKNWHQFSHEMNFLKDFLYFFAISSSKICTGQNTHLETHHL